MDLDEYRRVYMQAEGLGNTPKKLVERLATLGQSIVAVFGAAKKDLNERQARGDAFNKAIKDMKKEGFSFTGLVDIAINGPRISTHTSKALANVMNASLVAAKSTNELGQTAANIVGTAKRSNLYDGQDVEKGASFLINAKQITSKGLHVSKQMLKGVGLGLEGAAIAGDVFLKKYHHDKSTSIMPIDKGLDMGKGFGKEMKDINLDFDR